jgi:hypothetical protein
MMMLDLTEGGIDLYYDLIASATHSANYWQGRIDAGFKSIYPNINLARELALNTTDLYRYISCLSSCESNHF